MRVGRKVRGLSVMRSASLHSLLQKLSTYRIEVVLVMLYRTLLDRLWELIVIVEDWFVGWRLRNPASRKNAARVYISGSYIYI